MELVLIALVVSVFVLQTTCEECLKCPKNEILDKCKNPCQPTCERPIPPICEFLVCQVGCVCQPGYLRDELTNLCVLPRDCSIICPSNEEKNCKQQRCEQTCQNYPTGVECSTQPKPCICKPGFLRDLDSGECVPLGACPKLCGVNEEWTNCSDKFCRPTCQNMNKPLACKIKCEPGCSCKEGFIWNEDTQTCVPKDSCPKQCPPNEINNCKQQQCESTCPQQSSGLKCYSYIKDCVCQVGFLRDLSTGKCVSLEQCPKECGKNEVWNICTNPACRRTCQNRFESNRFCPLICVPACECKKGYIWDEVSKKCILEKECPPYVCGVNEEWKNCSDRLCRKSCQNLGQNIPCPCEPGCSCKAGFIWDENTQKCIPKNKCPKQCPPNEVYNCKEQYCEPSCQNQPSSLQCYIKPPKCICADGFFRDAISRKCIPLEKCPKICSINEEWKECSDIHCRRTCQNRGQPLICTEICTPGCSCKEGFIWDENSNQCIPENLCPEVCGINEEWKECSDIYCRKTCQNKGQILSCPKICKSGCSCKTGFIWDNNSKQCIPEDLCPEKCAANEIENCKGAYCEPTCLEQPSTFKCYSQPKKCICPIGLSRDLVSGKCVVPEQCPKVCKNNEEWDTCTYSFCKKTCQNRFRTSTVCPITVCAAGCRCKNGFIWDEISKTCIPEYSCPVNECGTNEVWANCSDKYCRQSCQTINKIRHCPRLQCQPGCVCQQGFIWNEETKRCIPQGQCPNICGINEVWKECSDVNCRDTCQRKRPKVCLKMCMPGCSCKDGYIWDEYLQKCVDRCEYSQGCGENQEWCRYVPDDLPTCQSLLRRRSYDIYRPNIVKLRPGCKCTEGYIWDENCGKCVLPIQCSGFL